MDTTLTETVIKGQCRQLHLPSVGARCMSVEQEAIRTHVSHSAYLSSLLEQELEDRAQRRAQRRISEARFPQVKPLSDFQFAKAPIISASQIAGLAEGGYIERGENILFVGDGGTGKTMLATALGVAACRQGRAVRFTTVAALVNELLEARDQQGLSRVVARWARVELMIADELGYVSLPATGAELLFQVMAERSERASVIVTTNLPFSEWTNVFPDPRLCKAVVERLTYRSHIIETGADSYRFRQSLDQSQSRERGQTKRSVQTRATVAASAPRNEGTATPDTSSHHHEGQPES